MSYFSVGMVYLYGKIRVPSKHAQHAFRKWYEAVCYIHPTNQYCDDSDKKNAAGAQCYCTELHAHGSRHTTWRMRFATQSHDSRWRHGNTAYLGALDSSSLPPEVMFRTPATLKQYYYYTTATTPASLDNSSASFEFGASHDFGSVCTQPMIVGTTRRKWQHQVHRPLYIT